MAGRQDVPRLRDRAQVRELLREQSGMQWGSLLIMWLVAMGGFWLLDRFFTRIFDLLPLLVMATLMVGLEAYRQHRRRQRLGHVLDADPILVRITDLGPRLVTVAGRQGPVRLPVTSTGGFDVGEDVWAVPAPVAGVRVVLVRREARPGPGSIDLIMPRGEAESV